MPFVKGMKRPPGAGRKKGVRNLHTMMAAEIMAAMKIEPLEILARVALGDLPCTVCRGTGRSKYQPDTEGAAQGKRTKLLERICQSCYGSGKEKISPELIVQAAGRLARFKHPELKEIEWRSPAAAVASGRQVNVNFILVQADKTQQPEVPRPKVLELPPADRTAS